MSTVHRKPTLSASFVDDVLTLPPELVPSSSRSSLSVNLFNEFDSSSETKELMPFHDDLYCCLQMAKDRQANVATNTDKNQIDNIVNSSDSELDLRLPLYLLDQSPDNPHPHNGTSWTTLQDSDSLSSLEYMHQGSSEFLHRVDASVVAGSESSSDSYLWYGHPFNDNILSSGMSKANLMPSDLGMRSCIENRKLGNCEKHTADPCSLAIGSLFGCSQQQRQECSAAPKWFADEKTAKGSLHFSLRNARQTLSSSCSTQPYDKVDEISPFKCDSFDDSDDSALFVKDEGKDSLRDKPEEMSEKIRDEEGNRISDTGRTKDSCNVKTESCEKTSNIRDGFLLRSLHTPPKMCATAKSIAVDASTEREFLPLCSGGLPSLSVPVCFPSQSRTAVLRHLPPKPHGKSISCSASLLPIPAPRHHSLLSTSLVQSSSVLNPVPITRMVVYNSKDGTEKSAPIHVEIRHTIKPTSNSDRILASVANEKTFKKHQRKKVTCCVTIGEDNINNLPTSKTIATTGVAQQNHIGYKSQGIREQLPKKSFCLNMNNSSEQHELQSLESSVVHAGGLCLDKQQMHCIPAAIRQTALAQSPTVGHPRRLKSSLVWSQSLPNRTHSNHYCQESASMIKSSHSEKLNRPTEAETAKGVTRFCSQSDIAARSSTPRSCYDDDDDATIHFEELQTASHLIQPRFPCYRDHKCNPDCSCVLESLQGSGETMTEDMGSNENNDAFGNHYSVECKEEKNKLSQKQNYISATRERPNNKRAKQVTIQGKRYQRFGTTIDFRYMALYHGMCRRSWSDTCLTLSAIHSNCTNFAHVKEPQTSFMRMTSGADRPKKRPESPRRSRPHQEPKLSQRSRNRLESLRTQRQGKNLKQAKVQRNATNRKPRREYLTPSQRSSFEQLAEDEGTAETYCCGLKKRRRVNRNVGILSEDTSEDDTDYIDEFPPPSEPSHSVIESLKVESAIKNQPQEIAKSSVTNDSLYGPPVQKRNLLQSATDVSALASKSSAPFSYPIHVDSLVASKADAWQQTSRGDLFRLQPSRYQSGTILNPYYFNPRPAVRDEGVQVTPVTTKSWYKSQAKKKHEDQENPSQRSEQPEKQSIPTGEEPSETTEEDDDDDDPVLINETPVPTPQPENESENREELSTLSTAITAKTETMATTTSESQKGKSLSTDRGKSSEKSKKKTTNSLSRLKDSESQTPKRKKKQSKKQKKKKEPECLTIGSNFQIINEDERDARKRQKSRCQEENADRSHSRGGRSRHTTKDTGMSHSQDVRSESRHKSRSKDRAKSYSHSRERSPTNSRARSPTHSRVSTITDSDQSDSISEDQSKRKTRRKLQDESEDDDAPSHSRSSKGGDKSKNRSSSKKKKGSTDEESVRSESKAKSKYKSRLEDEFSTSESASESSEVCEVIAPCRVVKRCHSDNPVAYQPFVEGAGQHASQSCQAADDQSILPSIPSRHIKQLKFCDADPRNCGTIASSEPPVSNRTHKRSDRRKEDGYNTQFQKCTCCMQKPVKSYGFPTYFLVSSDEFLKHRGLPIADKKSMENKDAETQAKISECAEVQSLVQKSVTMDSKDAETQAKISEYAEVQSLVQESVTKPELENTVVTKCVHVADCQTDDKIMISRDTQYQSRVKECVSKEKQPVSDKRKRKNRDISKEKDKQRTLLDCTCLVCRHCGECQRCASCPQDKTICILPAENFSNGYRGEAELELGEFSSSSSSICTDSNCSCHQDISDHSDPPECENEDVTEALPHCSTKNGFKRQGKSGWTLNSHPNKETHNKKRLSGGHKKKREGHMPSRKKNSLLVGPPAGPDLMSRLAFLVCPLFSSNHDMKTLNAPCVVGSNIRSSQFQLDLEYKNTNPPNTLHNNRLNRRKNVGLKKKSVSCTSVLPVPLLIRREQATSYKCNPFTSHKEKSGPFKKRDTKCQTNALPKNMKHRHSPEEKRGHNKDKLNQTSDTVLVMDTLPLLTRAKENKPDHSSYMPLKKTSKKQGVAGFMTPKPQVSHCQDNLGVIANIKKYSSTGSVPNALPSLRRNFLKSPTPKPLPCTACINNAVLNPKEPYVVPRYIRRSPCTSTCNTHISIPPVCTLPVCPPARDNFQTCDNSSSSVKNGGLTPKLSPFSTPQSQAQTSRPTAGTLSHLPVPGNIVPSEVDNVHTQTERFESGLSVDTKLHAGSGGSNVTPKQHATSSFLCNPPYWINTIPDREPRDLKYITSSSCEATPCQMQCFKPVTCTPGPVGACRPDSVPPAPCRKPCNNTACLVNTVSSCEQKYLHVADPTCASRGESCLPSQRQNTTVLKPELSCIPEYSDNLSSDATCARDTEDPGVTTCPDENVCYSAESSSCQGHINCGSKLPSLYRTENTSGVSPQVNGCLTVPCTPFSQEVSNVSKLSPCSKGLTCVTVVTSKTLLATTAASLQEDAGITENLTEYLQRKDNTCTVLSRSPVEIVCISPKSVTTESDKVRGVVCPVDCVQTSAVCVHTKETFCVSMEKLTNEPNTISFMPIGQSCQENASTALPVTATGCLSQTTHACFEAAVCHVENKQTCTEEIPCLSRTTSPSCSCSSIASIIDPCMSEYAAQCHSDAPCEISSSPGEIFFEMVKKLMSEGSRETKQNPKACKYPNDNNKEVELKSCPQHHKRWTKSRTKIPEPKITTTPVVLDLCALMARPHGIYSGPIREEESAIQLLNRADKTSSPKVDACTGWVSSEENTFLIGNDPTPKADHDQNESRWRSVEVLQHSKSLRDKTCRLQTKVVVCSGPAMTSRLPKAAYMTSTPCYSRIRSPPHTTYSTGLKEERTSDRYDPLVTPNNIFIPNVLKTQKISKRPNSPCSSITEEDKPTSTICVPPKQSGFSPHKITFPKELTSPPFTMQTETQNLSKPEFLHYTQCSYADSEKDSEVPSSGTFKSKSLTSSVHPDLNRDCKLPINVPRTVPMTQMASHALPGSATEAGVSDQLSSICIPRMVYLSHKNPCDLQEIGIEKNNTLLEMTCDTIPVCKNPSLASQIIPRTIRRSATRNFPQEAHICLQPPLKSNTPLSYHAESKLVHQDAAGPPPTPSTTSLIHHFSSGERHICESIQTSCSMVELSQYHSQVNYNSKRSSPLIQKICTKEGVDSDSGNLLECCRTSFKSGEHAVRRDSCEVSGYVSPSTQSDIPNLFDQLLDKLFRFWCVKKTKSMPNMLCASADSTSSCKLPCMSRTSHFTFHDMNEDEHDSMFCPCYDAIVGDTSIDEFCPCGYLSYDDTGNLQYDPSIISRMESAWTLGERTSSNACLPTHMSKSEVLKLGQRMSRSCSCINCSGLRSPRLKAGMVHNICLSDTKQASQPGQPVWHKVPHQTGTRNDDSSSATRYPTCKLVTNCCNGNIADNSSSCLTNPAFSFPQTSQLPAEQDDECIQKCAVKHVSVGVQTDMRHCRFCQKCKNRVPLQNTYGLSPSGHHETRVPTPRQPRMADVFKLRNKPDMPCGPPSKTSKPPCLPKKPASTLKRKQKDRNVRDVWRDTPRVHISNLLSQTMGVTSSKPPQCPKRTDLPEGRSNCRSIQPNSNSIMVPCVENISPKSELCTLLRNSTADPCVSVAQPRKRCSNAGLSETSLQSDEDSTMPQIVYRTVKPSSFVESKICRKQRKTAKQFKDSEDNWLNNGPCQAEQCCTVLGRDIHPQNVPPCQNDFCPWENMFKRSHRNTSSSLEKMGTVIERNSHSKIRCHGTPTHTKLIPKQQKLACTPPPGRYLKLRKPMPCKEEQHILPETCQPQCKLQECRMPVHTTSPPSMQYCDEMEECYNTEEVQYPIALSLMKPSKCCSINPSSIPTNKQGSSCHEPCQSTFSNRDLDSSFRRGRDFSERLDSPPQPLDGLCNFNQNDLEKWRLVPPLPTASQKLKTQKHCRIPVRKCSQAGCVYGAPLQLLRQRVNLNLSIPEDDVVKTPPLGRECSLCDVQQNERKPWWQFPMFRLRSGGGGQKPPQIPGSSNPPTERFVERRQPAKTCSLTNTRRAPVRAEPWEGMPTQPVANMNTQPSNCPHFLPAYGTESNQFSNSQQFPSPVRKCSLLGAEDTPRTDPVPPPGILYGVVPPVYHDNNSSHPPTNTLAYGAYPQAPQSACAMHPPCTCGVVPTPLHPNPQPPPSTCANIPSSPCHPPSVPCPMCNTPKAQPPPSLCISCAECQDPCTVIKRLPCPPSNQRSASTVAAPDSKDVGTEPAEPSIQATGLQTDSVAQSDKGSQAGKGLSSSPTDDKKDSKASKDSKADEDKASKASNEEKTSKGSKEEKTPKESTEGAE